MSLRLRLVLLAALVLGLAGFGLFLASGERIQREIEQTGPTVWRSSLQCRACHEEVWNEWLGSHHQVAYLNPEVRLLSDDFRDKACQACHLPRPVSLTGFGQRTLHRNTLPNEGVSCLTCHLDKDGTLLARNARPDVPCAPKESADITSVSLCESCHNQHQTTDQWRASRFAAEGTDCNDCHMPERPGGGRGHDFRGPHDLETLRKGIRLDVAREGDELVLALENFEVGHNFPSEERSRAADVRVRFEPASAPADSADGESVDGGGEWIDVHRFRLPYRYEPLPDTTLPAGETHTMRTPIPDGATAAVARLWYRTTPYSGDDDPHGALVFEQRIDWSQGEARLGELVTPPTDSPIFAPRMDLAADLAAATLADAGAGETLNAPPLPALDLQPRLDAIRALAERRTQPAEEEQERLNGLLEGAFAATGEFAALSREELLADANVEWALEAGLVHDDENVRSNSAFELGELGRREAVPALLQRLKYWEEDGYRVSAVWVADALTKLGNHAGLPFLGKWMQRDDMAQAAGLRAIDVLRRLGNDPGEQPTYDALRESLDELHRAWLAEGRVADDPNEADEATRMRIAALLAQLEGFRLRPVDETRFVLTRMGRAAVPQLEEAAHASEPFLRTHALEVLRDLGSAARDAAPTVLPLLGDELCSADAARALGRLGDPLAVPHLVARLASPDLELRAACAGALGPLGDRGAIAPLEALLADATQPMDVRVQAAFSLALLAPDGGARAWLEARLAAGDYYEPTLNELLGRLDGTR